MSNLTLVARVHAGYQAGRHDVIEVASVLIAMVLGEGFKSLGSDENC